MTMKLRVPFILGSLATACAAFAQVTIHWFPVGDPGNPADEVSASNSYGAVPYGFHISKFETTIARYTAFLDAVAASDPHGLWKSRQQDVRNVAGIAGSGPDEAYTYSVIGSRSRSIAYTTYVDATRFTNWLQNGQSSGDTETGAYTLRSATIIGFKRSSSTAPCTPRFRCETGRQPNLQPHFI